MKPESHVQSICTDMINCSYNRSESSDKPQADNRIHIMPPALRMPDPELLGMRHVKLVK